MGLKRDSFKCPYCEAPSPFPSRCECPVAESAGQYWASEETIAAVAFIPLNIRNAWNVSMAREIGEMFRDGWRPTGEERGNEREIGRQGARQWVTKGIAWLLEMCQEHHEKKGKKR